mmetsp:Transcript_37184/g.124565  ORF Transcript_37184/g.124565 Transcript_37184/m.124565 type:complete len:530 (+) Transcript_37184:1148-2737(+)
MQRADFHVVPPAVRHVVRRVCVLVAAERLPDHVRARQRRADGSHPRLANLGEEVNLAVHVDLRRRLVAVREQVGHHVVHAVHVHRGHHVDHAELEPVGEAAAAEDHQPVEVSRRHGVVVPLLVHPVRHLRGEVLQHVASRQRPLAARHRLLRRRHDQQLHWRSKVLPVDVGDGDEGIGGRVCGLHERRQVLDVREARERHRERNHRQHEGEEHDRRAALRAAAEVRPDRLLLGRRVLDDGGAVDRRAELRHRAARRTAVRAEGRAVEAQPEQAVGGEEAGHGEQKRGRERERDEHRLQHRCRGAGRHGGDGGGWKHEHGGEAEGEGGARDDDGVSLSGEGDLERLRDRAAVEALLVEAREEEEGVVDGHGEGHRHEHRGRAHVDVHDVVRDGVHDKEGCADPGQDVAGDQAELPDVAQHNGEHDEGEDGGDGRERHPPLDPHDDVLVHDGVRDKRQVHLRSAPTPSSQSALLPPSRGAGAKGEARPATRGTPPSSTRGSSPTTRAARRPARRTTRACRRTPCRWRGRSS